MLTDVWDALTSTLALTGDVLTRETLLPERILSGSLLGPSLGVAALAWLSVGVGQSGVLFINRLSGVRIAVSAAIGLVWMLVLRVTEALVTWGVALLVTARDLSPEVVLTVFLLATAPHVFNVITFLPHVGIFLGRALEVWSFLVLFILIGSVYTIPGWEALLVTASGWLVIQVLSRLLAAPLGWVGSRVWTLATGRRVLLTSRDVLAGTPFVPVPADPETLPAR